MNRRHFCMAGAAALASLSVPAAAGSLRPGPVSGCCRVKVVRRCSFQDLQSCWSDDPDIGACEAFKDGQEIKVTPATYAALERGEGFCPHAWRAIKPYVDAIMAGDSAATCSPVRPDGAAEAIVCCPEGTRPVIFALSRGREEQ